MLNQLCLLDARCALWMTAAWGHPREAWGEEPSVPKCCGGVSVLLPGVTWQLQFGFDEAVATEPKHPIYFFSLPDTLSLLSASPLQTDKWPERSFPEVSTLSINKSWQTSLCVSSPPLFSCHVSSISLTFCQEFCKCNAEGKKRKCAFRCAG